MPGTAAPWPPKRLPAALAGGAHCQAHWLISCCRLKKHNKSYKYFSSISKLVQCWRDCAGRMFDEWLASFGPKPARDFAAKLPPKCLAGRWDSIHNCESFMAKTFSTAPLLSSTGVKGREIPQLPHVLRKVLTTKAKAAPTILALAGGSKDGIFGVEDPMNESSTDYARRLGRWRSDTLSTVDDYMYPDILKVVSDSHKPLQHHMGFVSALISDADLDSKGGHVAQFVGGFGEKIFLECGAAFENTQWAKDISCNSSPGSVSSLLELGVIINAHHGAAYQRRIVEFLARLGVCVGNLT
jgi:hypothetical protein